MKYRIGLFITGYLGLILTPLDSQTVLLSSVIKCAEFLAIRSAEKMATKSTQQLAT